MLLYFVWPRRASGRRRAYLVNTIQTSSNTQLSLLSRLAGLGSFVGVRSTRFAHSAPPHCARRRILAFGSDPLFSARATSSTGRTLADIR